MMNRSTTSAVVGRASSMRRMRRRTQSAFVADAATGPRQFCRTNGCPSFLELDATTDRSTCVICGYTARTR